MTSTHTDSSSANSTPPSPATTMSAETTAIPAAENSLDDIFGSSPETSTVGSIQATRPAPESSTGTEPSDLPSLRRQHVTAGYRDGLSTSKGQHVQAGFDGGFPVGAQLGMRAGTVLGILEGISRGLEERGGAGVAKKPAARAGGTSTATQVEGPEMEARRRAREQVRKAYEEAVKALDVQAVFTGMEARPVVQPPLGPEDNREREGGNQKEEPEKQLGRKGDEIVAGWEERVAVPQWEKNMEALEMREQKEDRQGDEGKGERS